MFIPTGPTKIKNTNTQIVIKNLKTFLFIYNKKYVFITHKLSKRLAKNIFCIKSKSKKNYVKLPPPFPPFNTIGHPA